MFFDNHIFVCNNRREPGHTRGCCAEKGSDELRDYMKQKIKDLKLPKTRVNQAGCLDRCELGPCLVIYPEGVWYSPKNKSDIDAIINEHLLGGKIVERLALPRT
jgi:(2Fe-2S) ferredoxin